MTEQEILRYKKELKMQDCFSFFGSKSWFREQNPLSLPIFNCCVKYVENGDLVDISGFAGDIDLTNFQILKQLCNVSKELESDIFLYYQSESNNVNSFLVKFSSLNEGFILFKDHIFYQSSILRNLIHSRDIENSNNILVKFSDLP